MTKSQLLIDGHTLVNLENITNFALPCSRTNLANFRTHVLDLMSEVNHRGEPLCNLNSSNTC